MYNEQSSKIGSNVDQAPDGVNGAVLTFRESFPNINITDQEQMLAIQDHISRVRAANPDAGDELLRILNAATADQLPAEQTKQDHNFVDSVAKPLEGVTLEDLEHTKGHDATDYIE